MELLLLRAWAGNVGLSRPVALNHGSQPSHSVQLCCCSGFEPAIVSQSFICPSLHAADSGGAFVMSLNHRYAHRMKVCRSFLDGLDRGESGRLCDSSSAWLCRSIRGTHWQKTRVWWYQIALQLVNVPWQFGTEMGDCCVDVSGIEVGRLFNREEGVNNVCGPCRPLVALRNSQFALESMAALVGHSSQCPAPPQIRNQHLKSHLKTCHADLLSGRPPHHPTPANG